jgi:hypothetical protein
MLCIALPAAGTPRRSTAESPRDHASDAQPGMALPVSWPDLAER